MVYNRIMDVKLIKNILSDQDLKDLEDAIDREFNSRAVMKLNLPTKSIEENNSVCYYSGLGRIDIKYPNIPQHILDKIYNSVVKNLDEEIELLSSDFVMYAEYTKSSGGNPRLEPHFDIVDFGTVILDYQFKSNKVWEVKVESDFFALEDNSAILFDPSEKIHSRTVRTFSDDEFVKMLFFRFKTSTDLVPRTRLDKERLVFEQDWHVCEEVHVEKFKERYENR